MALHVGARQLKNSQSLHTVSVRILTKVRLSRRSYAAASADVQQSASLTAIALCNYNRTQYTKVCTSQAFYVVCRIRGSDICPISDRPRLCSPSHHSSVSREFGRSRGEATVGAEVVLQNLAASAQADLQSCAENALLLLPLWTHTDVSPGHGDTRNQGVLFLLLCLTMRFSRLANLQVRWPRCLALLR